jgi:hypothetical protein
MSLVGSLGEVDPRERDVCLDLKNGLVADTAAGRRCAISDLQSSPRCFNDNTISRLKTQISASQLLTDPLRTFIGNIGAMAEIRDSILEPHR